MNRVYELASFPAALTASIFCCSDFAAFGGHFEAPRLLGCDAAEHNNAGDGNHGKACHSEHYNFLHTYLMIRKDRDQRVFVKKFVTRSVICWTRSTTSVRRYSSESVS